MKFDAATADSRCGTLDPHALANLRRFGEGRGSETLDALVGTFAGEAIERVARMRTAIQIGDFDTVAITAHNLRGASLSVAGTLLGASCARLQALAGEKDQNRCTSAINDLEQEAGRLIAELRRTLVHGTFEKSAE